MPIAPATVFPTVTPTVPVTGAPVVSAGFGEAVDGVIGTKPGVLPPAFSAPRPEDTAVLLATAQAAPVVAVVPAEGKAEVAAAAPTAAGEPAAQREGAPASPVSLPPAFATPGLAASVPQAPASAVTGAAEIVLPATDAAAAAAVPAPASEPERGVATPDSSAPARPATKPADEAEAQAVAIAPPAAAPLPILQGDAGAVAQVASPVPSAVDAPAGDESANDHPLPKDSAPTPASAPVPALSAALPAPTVSTAPVAVVAPKDAPRSEAFGVRASPESSPPSAADQLPHVAAHTGELASVDPQQSFADRLAAQAPAVRAGSDAAPTPAASLSGAPVQAQAPSATAAAPLTSPAPPAAPVPIHPPSVTAQPGRIGREIGVAIARRVVDGGQELTVRLNPAELGRIEVKMGFSEHGTLRATVAAESAVALDLLRRDSADLGRALADAGVRADAQSFRFDTRSGDGGGAWQRQGGQGGQNGSPGHPSYPGGRGYPAELPDSEPVYRALRTSGRVDLMA